MWVWIPSLPFPYSDLHSRIYPFTILFSQVYCHPGPFTHWLFSLPRIHFPELGIWLPPLFTCSYLFSETVSGQPDQKSLPWPPS